jgi:glycosyltransferase involved in cell wall biosynthesis
MKIALVVPGGVDRSGEVRVIPAVLALIRRVSTVHELHVFATHQEDAPGTWQLEGAQIHNIGLPRTPWRSLRSIFAEHRQAPFAVVHSLWAGSSGALAVASATLRRVPSIVHVAGGELVALADIRYGGCLSLRGRVLQRTVLRRATRVTAASRAICELVARYRVTAQRVPLGVDLQCWPLRPPIRRRPSEQPRLVHVANLNRVKDQGTLLRALRVLADRGRDFHLDVIGEDTLGGETQALAAELGVAERIRFHGFLPQREVRRVVEAAHVAVVSSRHEAGPLVVLEAAAAGLPTVGTAVGHIAEWSPQAAVAVPCLDPDALASALERVLADEDLRLLLAAEAQRRVERVDAEQTARAFAALYAELAEPQ